MAVLGGVDGTNDKLGRQKTALVQKRVWKGLPSPEESHDTVFILNLCVSDFVKWPAARSRTLSVIRVVGMLGLLDILYSTSDSNAISCGTARALIMSDQRDSHYIAIILSSQIWFHSSA